MYAFLFSCISFTSADYPEITKIPVQSDRKKEAVVFLAYSDPMLRELRNNHELRKYHGYYDLDLEDVLKRQKKGEVRLHHENFLLFSAGRQQRYLINTEVDSNEINSPWMPYSVIHEVLMKQKYSDVSIMPLFETMSLKGMPPWIKKKITEKYALMEAERKYSLLEIFSENELNNIIAYTGNYCKLNLSSEKLYSLEELFLIQCESLSSLINDKNAIQSGNFSRITTSTPHSQIHEEWYQNDKFQTRIRSLKSIVKSAAYTASETSMLQLNKKHADYFIILLESYPKNSKLSKLSAFTCFMSALIIPCYSRENLTYTVIHLNQKEDKISRMDFDVKTLMGYAAAPVLLFNRNLFRNKVSRRNLTYALNYNLSQTVIVDSPQNEKIQKVWVEAGTIHTVMPDGRVRIRQKGIGLVQSGINVYIEKNLKKSVSITLASYTFAEGRVSGPVRASRHQKVFFYRENKTEP